MITKSGEYGRKGNEGESSHRGLFNSEKSAEASRRSRSRVEEIHSTENDRPEWRHLQTRRPHKERVTPRGSGDDVAHIIAIVSERRAQFRWREQMRAVV